MSQPRFHRDHYKRNLTPKKRFQSIAAAQAHADRYGPRDLVIYQCSVCCGYHFATPRPAERRRTARARQERVT
jgi:hypothetical protein